MQNFFKIFIGIILILTGCTKTKTDLAVLSANPPVSAVQEIDIDQLSGESQSKTEFLRIPAIIKSEYSSAVGFQTSGMIAKLNVQVGDFVKQNQELASLDFTAASLDLENAKLDLENKTIAFKQTQKRYTRSLALFKSGNLSKVALEDEENNFKISKINCESSEVNLKAKNHALQLTKLTAPFDGLITKSYKSLGDSTHAGAPVFDLMQIHNLSVFAQVPAAYFNKIKIGMMFSLFNPLNDETGSITIQKVIPVIDAQTHTFDIYGKINEITNNFVPGMYVEIIMK